MPGGRPARARCGARRNRPRPCSVTLQRPQADCAQRSASVVGDVREVDRRRNRRDVRGVEAAKDRRTRSERRSSRVTRAVRELTTTMIRPPPRRSPGRGRWRSAGRRDRAGGRPPPAGSASPSVTSACGPGGAAADAIDTAPRPGARSERGGLVLTPGRVRCGRARGAPTRRNTMTAVSIAPSTNFAESARPAAGLHA